MRKTIIMLIWSLAMVRAYAQQSPPDNATTHSFSLQDCINYAYEHQNAVKNAVLDVKSAEYRVKEIIGSGLPQISGAAAFQDYVKIPTTLIPGEFFGQPGTFIPVKFAVQYQSNLTLNASQQIFDGSYLVGLQARKTYTELASRSFQRSKIEANVAVTKAYYQVLVSNEQINLLDANIKELKTQYEQTVAANKQGFVEQIDVQRLEVQYNNLLTQRTNVLNSLVLNYQMLKFQMGMPVEENLVLITKLENVKLDEDVASTTVDTAFYRNRVEYNLQELQTRFNKFDVKLKKAQFLPKLTANGSYSSSYQANTFGNLYNTSFPSAFIGLSLNVPIFNGNQRKNQLRQSEITLLKSQNDLYELKNSLTMQANVARTSFTNGIRSLQNQRKNQALAAEVLRVAKIKYQQGVGSSIEVTQAETDLQSANNQYIQSLYDALVSKVDLDKAYGRIQ